MKSGSFFLFTSSLGLKSQHGPGVMGSILGTGTSPRTSLMFHHSLLVVVLLKIRCCLKPEAIEAV